MFTGKNKKKRSNPKKNPPPPLFTSDRLPAFGSQNQKPNKSPSFPRRSGSPPALPMNSDEMFDRFNQLLDWDLPNQGNNRNIPLDKFDEYDRAGRSSERPQVPSYFTRSPDDLRNRLDQQNKRWKMQEDFGTHEPRVFQEDWPHLPNRRQSDMIPENSQRDFTDRRYKLDYLMEERRRLNEEDWNGRDARFIDMQRREIRADQWHDGDYDSGLSRNNRQDFGREVKEFWPERNMPETEFSHNDGRYVSYNREKGYPRDGNEAFENSRENYIRNIYSMDFPQHNRHYDDDDGVYEENRRVSEPSPPRGKTSDDRIVNYDLSRNRYSNYDQQNVQEKYFMENMPSTSTYRSPGNSLKGTGIGGHSGENQYPGKPLKVIIYKANNETFTIREADFLRSTLIDRLVDCENPNYIPEFVRAGLVRGARSFVITCRSQESLYWLMQQPLPRLDNVELIMQKQTENATVCISVFVGRCTRSKEAAWKLLKLQNNKKGLNFDNWIMKSYQSAPNGLFMSFDVTLDEARRLKDLDCKLSFELKTIKFKIANENSTN